MAVILQQNVGKRVEALTMLMETAMERKADLVLVQEPPACVTTTHPGYTFLRDRRVLTARRVDSDWTVTTEDNLTREAEGDVQVLALGRRGHQGRQLRVVNAYFQKDGRSGTYRPAERAKWEEILGTSRCIVAGDFNAHSRMWNPYCTTARNAAFLEDLIVAHELRVLNDERETRPTRGGGSLHSIIDLTLATPEAGLDIEGWRVVEDDDQATTSDHVMLEWKWTGWTMKVDPGWKIRGWALKKRLDQEKEEERMIREKKAVKKGPTMGETWIQKTSTVPLGEVGYGVRPTLDDTSTVEELEDEIEWVQSTLIDILNQHCKVATICARSKRWWNDEIREKRKTLGRTTRRWKREGGGYAEVKEAKKILRRAIKKARRECWEDFLNQAEGDDI